MPANKEQRREAYLAKTNAELAKLEAQGVLCSGNAFCQVLFVKGELNAAERSGEALLSGEDGTALRSALASLGYAPEAWAALATSMLSGAASSSVAKDAEANASLVNSSDESRRLEPINAPLLRLCVSTFDPETLIALDEIAALALREAYAEEFTSLPKIEEAMFAEGVVANILGMRFLALGGFEAALTSDNTKRLAWARLKLVPPLGEPF